MIFGNGTLITTLAREYSASILHQWTVIIATKTITIWLIMGQSMHMGKPWRGFCDLIYYLCCDKEKILSYWGYLSEYDKNWSKILVLPSSSNF